MKYLDFHTHKTTNEDSTTRILSVDIRQDIEAQIESCDYFVIGIHPWFLKELDVDHSLSLISKYLNHKKCIGLGECGLDRAIEVPMSEQIDCFNKQLRLAKELKKNIVILHSVKTYNDILSVTNNYSEFFSLVFHDYNGGEEVTKDLLKKDVYFSYGNKLFNEKSKGHKSLLNIPIDRLFLETDDMSVSIDQVYERAAFLLGLNVKQLKEEMINNFESLLKTTT